MPAASVVVPVRERPRVRTTVRDHLGSNDPFEEVQEHPVPRHEPPRAVPALVPSSKRVSRVRPVDRRLVRPAGGVRGRLGFHRRDRIRVGRQDRVGRGEGPDVDPYERLCHVQPLSKAGCLGSSRMFSRVYFRASGSRYRIHVKVFKVCHLRAVVEVHVSRLRRPREDRLRCAGRHTGWPAGIR